LRFSFEMSAARDDVCGLDTPLCEFQGNATDFRTHPATAAGQLVLGGWLDAQAA
jgi:hypothetical protein